MSAGVIALPAELANGPGMGRGPATAGVAPIEGKGPSFKSPSKTIWSVYALIPGLFDHEGYIRASGGFTDGARCQRYKDHLHVKYPQNRHVVINVNNPGEASTFPMCDGISDEELFK